MPRRLILVLAGLLAVTPIGGCGGGDKKASTTSTSSSSSAPQSKAEYEKQLRAALTPPPGAASLGNQVSPKTPPATAAKVFDQVSLVYRQAYARMRSIVPPKDVAALHTQIAGVLSRLAQRTANVRDALRRNDKVAQAAAVADINAQNQMLKSLGQQLAARGY